MKYTSLFSEICSVYYCGIMQHVWRIFLSHFEASAQLDVNLERQPRSRRPSGQSIMDMHRHLFIDLRSDLYLHFLPSFPDGLEDFLDVTLVCDNGDVPSDPE